MDNIYNLIAQHQLASTYRVAVIDGTNEYSYGVILAQVDAVAEFLCTQGIKPGDRVGIHCNKSIEEIVAIFAVAKVGAVSVNINYRFRTAQCAYILRDCGARGLVTDRSKAQAIVQESEAVSSTAIFVLNGQECDVAQSSDPAKWGSGNDLDPAIPHNLATILYTSGSTGMPKGVMVSHRMLIEGANIVSGYLNNKRDDRLLSLVPLSFDYGLNQLMSMCLLGGTVILQRTAMPSAIVDRIITNKVTGMAAVPGTWIEMVNYLEVAQIDIPSLRYITNTGGSIPRTVLQKLSNLFPGVEIYLMYGFTEAFRSTFLPPDRFDDKCGSIGKDIPGVEIFVVDPHKGLCAANETGELIHSGSLISDGYWGNSVATVEKIGLCPPLRHLIGDKPVAYSGDLAYRDNDGFLWFVGRMDDMIKSSGFRMSPMEIEEIVHASGMVDNVVAFGVADHVRGQVIHIGITPCSDHFSVESLFEYCRIYMPTHMVPQNISVWPGRMPQTANGKIDRKTVVETLRIGINKD